MNSQKKIIISMGDPAGIGPDLCIMLAEKKFNAHITIVGNSATLEDRANLYKKKIIEQKKIDKNYQRKKKMSQSNSKILSYYLNKA